MTPQMSAFAPLRALSSELAQNSKLIALGGHTDATQRWRITLQQAWAATRFENADRYIVRDMASVSKTGNLRAGY